MQYILSDFLVDSIASIFVGMLVIRGSTLLQRPKRRNDVGDAIILISLRSIRRRICASWMETSNENTRESMWRRKSGEETHYAFTCWEECDSSSGRGGATLKDEKRTFQVANYRAGRCLVKNETDYYTPPLKRVSSTCYVKNIK